MRTGIAKLWRNLAEYRRWDAWTGVMALAMFAVCERVRLAMGAVLIYFCTLGGAWSMEGKMDCVRCAIGSSGLAVGICGTGMAGGIGMTNLGGDAGGRSYWGRSI